MSFSRCLLGILIVGVIRGVAQEKLPAPTITEITISNAQQRIQFTPFPAAEEFKIFKSDSLGQSFTELKAGTVSGYNWFGPVPEQKSMEFYKLQVKPLSDQDLLSSTVLNRLTYGPTPDEIDRIKVMGPDAYIQEQMAPESISEQLDVDVISTESGWQYITATGSASSTTLYIYLDSEGEGYIDDLKIVEGGIGGQGANLIRNGDFETTLTNDWVISPGPSSNMIGSVLTSEVKHSGNFSLKLVATEGGSTREDSIHQLNVPLVSGRRYTLSYWFLPSTNNYSSATVRLSGNGIDSSAPKPITKLAMGKGEIEDLQTWYLARAVQTRQQLLEILTQFFDNHFTTYFPKSEDYIGARVSGDAEDFIAADFEYWELLKWREVLKNPSGTFYDLLKISAESPAMIIYLDTVSNTKSAANENYACEIMELFTMGVDNGYDQRDIEEMSRAWTGWRVDKLPIGQENNPFTPAVTNRNTDPGTWTLRFSASNHDTNSKTIFPGKTIDARFGSPHAGKSYELHLPARSGRDGMKDGYEIVTHLADLPYTQEYISVKLCQVFVHEKFFHGTYDYTDPNMSAEARLVLECMKAWETAGADGRKGNIRKILSVIFNSELFRHHSGSRQKVKTPLEFIVSSIRALRMAAPDGGFTANSNGENLLDALNQLDMEPFYREEPDGWPEAGQDWISTSSLIARMRIIQGYLKPGALLDPVSLLRLKLPSSQWNEASAVAGLFVDLLFWGEGKANLDSDRVAAIEFLNSNNAGVPNSSLFSTLNNTSSAYDTRVRGMVAFLMGLPRFQEQ